MPKDVHTAPRPSFGERLGALAVAGVVGGRPRRQRDRAGREGVDRGDARAQMPELAHERPHVAGHDALAPIRVRLPLRRAMHLDVGDARRLAADQRRCSRSACAVVRMMGASTVKAAASAKASWPHAVRGSIERVACSHGIVESASERRS